MTYRTPESLIRSIMSGTINESVASDHMNPALKTSDTARLTGAVEVLKASGVTSAEIKDNAISVSPAETMQASNILDAAFMHGLITVKPHLTSSNALLMPEPHVPAPEFAKEEKVEEANINMKLPDQKDAEDQTPEGDVVVNDINIELKPRSLRNRTENQVKKVDETYDVTNPTAKVPHENLVAQVMDGARPKISKGDIKGSTKHLVKSVKRQAGIAKAAKKLAKEEVELNELSYSRLKSYEKKGSVEVANAAKKNKLDKRIATRAAYVAKAKEKSATKLKKAAFGEEANPVANIVAICEGMRKVETLHSECGKHHATIHRDTDYNEYRVKFHINGKHHEPADSFHGDHDDAHHTAKAELKRMTKLNGALKESSLEEVKSLLEEEQIDELSKALLGRYVKKAAGKMADHGFDTGRASQDPKGDDKFHASFDKLSKRQKGLTKAVNKLTSEEVAKEGEIPFQIDEISKETLKRYIPKAEASRDKNFDLHSVHQNAARKMSNPEAKSNAYKKAHAHFDKGARRDSGVEKAKERLKEDAEQIDEITKIGTYSNHFGHTLTMHRSPNDPKHHMLVHNGQVVKTHHGSAEDFHKSLTKDGFHGALHEETIEEVSKGTLTNYVIKASSSKRDHLQKGAAAMARGNAAKGEPETKVAHQKVGQKHMLKANRRHEGIQKASKKIAEEVDLTEAKADAEKAKKVLFKHPEADAIGKTMMSATKHFNYVQDAVDHVYNNHSKNLSYEDFDKIRPHLEDHFKKSGLK